MAIQKAYIQIDFHDLNSSSNSFLPMWPAEDIYSLFCSTASQVITSKEPFLTTICLYPFSRAQFATQITGAQAIDQPKMAPFPTNSREDEHGQRRLEQDIRNAIASLTHHLTALGKSAVPRELSHTNGTVDHDTPSNRDGVRIITLTGSNKGAAMKVDGTAVGEVEETHGVLLGDERAMRAYTNSNYQAVNNSVLLGGSCSAEDPGVHISFFDFEKREADGRYRKKDETRVEKIDQSNV